MVVIIVLRSKIKLYEIRNHWYSHSIDEKNWNSKRLGLLMAGDKWRRQGSNPRTVRCVAPLPPLPTFPHTPAPPSVLVFHSPLHTLLSSLTALLFVPQAQEVLSCSGP